MTPPRPSTATSSFSSTAGTASRRRSPPPANPPSTSIFPTAAAGGFLVYTAAFLRRGTPNLGFVASSRPDDLASACEAFVQVKKSGDANAFGSLVASVRRAATPGRATSPSRPTACPFSPRRLPRGHESVQDPGRRRRRPGIAPAIKEQMGIPVVDVPFAEVNDAWAAADKDEAAAVADRWAEAAACVEGVSRDDARERRRRCTSARRPS
ncbi:MAG: hypothetical protein MZV49_06295 [Rhodopseudomonas palustris]|nr:hypothetical protein [Rhodopseudomonas palustris]